MSPLRFIALIALAGPGCITDTWLPPVSPADAGADTSLPDVNVDAPITRCVDAPLRALASGYRGFSCVIRCDGSVWCWGINIEGQLGDGTTTTQRIPVRVGGLPRPATALGLGYDASCVVLDDGSVWCWGRGGEGGIGAPGMLRSLTPLRVQGLSGAAVSVTAGGTHFCAALASGALACWGENFRGQLGVSGNTPRGAATPVTDLAGEVAEVVTGQYHTCVRRRDGTVSCWGQNAFGTLADGAWTDRAEPRDVPLPANAVALSTQTNHVCAALDDGSVWCWGYNSDGQLGNGGRTTSPRPVATVALPVQTTQLATASNHTCALGDDGTLRCWGGNEVGQLGDGSNTRRLRPAAAVTLDGPVTQTSTGLGFTCAALRNGRVFCWGDNTHGTLGDGTAQSRGTPVAVAFPP